ncbi:sialate O-acetylesterase [Pseudoxanthomonas indica]|nr:sialate O-acetylesterase [Pseudoxanthomonas indica]
MAMLLMAAPTMAQTPAPAPALLDALFQDHAVLQRDQPIRVWGQAQPGQRVAVQLAGRRTDARADSQGAWQASLPALPAGGPYTLSASSHGQEQHAGDVLIGDVWLCSGQSNMELPVWRTLDARSEIAGASNDHIRLLSVPQQGAAAPLASLPRDVRWQPVTPDSVREFSAACYYFARELQKSVGVPMGLIHASWGGSRIQAWMSGQALQRVGGYEEELAVLDRYARDPIDAINDWGQLWQRWWSRQPGVAHDDRPWSVTGIPAGDWQPAPDALGAWEHWGVPALADFNGMLWYRASMQLSAQQAAQAAVLVLGPADEIDMSWVNGRAVGSTYGADGDREYRLPAGLLHAGENAVVVNVLDTWRDGGLAGPASRHRLRLADGTQVPLQAWRYRRMSAEFASPPRAPWQTAGGMSTLYNGMIAPLGAPGLRGVLWYQGESNTGEAAHYAALLRALRSDWRGRFGTDVAWLIVQLAGFGMPPQSAGDSDWASLREAQRQVADEDPRSGLVVAIDIGDRYDIHPGNKQELGRRLARAARHVAYADAASASGPVPARVQRVGQDIVIDFDGVEGRLITYGAEEVMGLQLCGATTGHCRYARGSIRDHRLIVPITAATDEPAAASEGIAATRLRYCWADNPICNLFDASGLPAGPFEVPLPSAIKGEHTR